MTSELQSPSTLTLHALKQVCEATKLDEQLKNTTIAV